VLAGALGIPKNIAAYFELIDDFRPEVVISDFESWTYLYAKAHRLPIFSIDNMQIINRCDAAGRGHARARGRLPDRQGVREGQAPLLRSLPGHHLLPTPHPQARNDARAAHPAPRDPRREACPTGEHLLVYQTAEGNDALVETLKRTGLPCRMYGMKRDLTEDLVDGPLTYRPFSEAGFIADLASARGVIAGGGFTLMGEAVYLRKPMLSVPMGAHFEQLLNARYLEHEGFGQMALSLEDPAVVHGFVAQLPRFEEALSGYSQRGNEVLFEALDGLLDRAAAGL
jgi:uncharacterized protein (TIGR00661 family)